MPPPPPTQMMSVIFPDSYGGNAFYGWDAAALAYYLYLLGCKRYSLDYFFIADGQTASDGKLVLVNVKDGGVRTVRIELEMIQFDSLRGKDEASELN